MRTLMMAERPRYLLSLGDSMSIDVYAGGPGRGAASLLYQNRDADFPEWAGRDLKSRLPGVRLIPLAMDAGTSATVRYAQLPRFAEMGVKAAAVTLTMGGNDLLQTFGNEAAAEQAQRALRENGQAILSQVRKLCEPDAPLLLGTVYDPSDGTGDTGRLNLLPWPGALGWIHRFNETLRELAAKNDVLLVDLHALFLGHGLATGENPAQSDPRPANRDLYYCGVIEPNAWGASAIRAGWWDTLVGAGIVQETQ
ncbi:MAG: SGNH/GDSL hydrolase family protein [Armatimonadota bacterium]